MKTKSGKKRKVWYSGNDSIEFWKKINAIKDNEKHSEMYFLGVQLQNLEGYVLKKLEELS